MLEFMLTMCKQCATVNALEMCEHHANSWHQHVNVLATFCNVSNMLIQDNNMVNMLKHATIVLKHASDNLNML